MQASGAVVDTYSGANPDDLPVGTPADCTFFPQSKYQVTRSCKPGDLSFSDMHLKGVAQSTHISLACVSLAQYTRMLCMAPSAVSSCVIAAGDTQSM